MKYNNADENIEKIKKKINSNLEGILVISQKNYFCEILEKFNNKDNDEIYCELEKLLNGYLKELLPVYSKEEYDKRESIINDLVDYFIADKKSQLTEFIVEDGSTIAYDFLEKLTNNNDRNIELPINLKYLIEYSINNHVSKEDILKEVVWIVVLLGIICFTFKNC